MFICLDVVIDSIKVIGMIIKYQVVSNRSSCVDIGFEDDATLYELLRFNEDVVMKLQCCVQE